MFRFLFTTMLALCITASSAWACSCNFGQGGAQRGILESANAASGGDPVKKAALLRFAHLESGFGCAGGKVSNQNNGPYSYNIGTAVKNSSAYGTTQFTRTTWNDQIRNRKKLILQKTAAALRNTSDPIIKQQLNQFQSYLMGGLTPPSDPFYFFGGMTSVSIVMADVLAEANGSDAAAGVIARAAPDVNAYAVAAYLGHNGGAAEKNKIIAAINGGRLDTPVNQVVNPVTITNNPSIYCASNKGGCQPLTVRQVLANINNKGVSGQCVQQAFRLAGLPASTAGMPALSGGAQLYDFVPAAEEKPDPGLKILNSAKLAGESNENARCPFAKASAYCEENGKTANSAGKGGGSGAQNDGDANEAGDAAAGTQPLTDKDVISKVLKAGGPSALGDLRNCGDNRMCIVKVLNKNGVAPAPSRAGTGTAQTSEPAGQSQETTNALSRVGGTEALNRFKACNKNSVCEGTVLSDYKVPVPTVASNPAVAKPKTSQASPPINKPKSVTSDSGAQPAAVRADQSQAQKMAALERATINVRKANAAVTPQMAARTESARNFLKNPNLSAEARATFENQVAVYNQAVAAQKSAQAAYQKAYSAVKGQ